MAQNASDAAQRAGIPGRLRLSLTGGTLIAANTGAPLDAAGAESLSTLRASAKRADPGTDQPGTTGRFGVGFAAVRTVSDAPAVRSTSGGARWSLSEALELLGAVPVVAGELTMRGDAVPVLRLPFPEATPPPAGFDTAVVLPLRDEAAREAVRRQLGDLDPVLLLSLPFLAEVDVDGRRMTARPAGGHVLLDDDGELTRWQVVRRSGRLASRLLADRPTEERTRTAFDICCAVPLRADGAPVPLPSSVAAVLRTPTLTDEPLSLPAVLIGSWPMDSGRRRVASGPLADTLVAETADAYAELVCAVATGPAVLDLVPAGLAAGEVDATLRRAILHALADAPFLPLAGDSALAVRPRDAVALDLGPGPTAVLADVLPNLVAADWAARTGPLAVLGVRRMGLPEVVDALAGLDRLPSWWQRLYLALGETHLGGPERDALGALPVPLADGRLVRGPRGLLLPGDGLDPAGIAALGLRVVHPDAVAPLLTVLGAVPANPRSLLDEPRLQAAVAASFDTDDPDPIAEAVLSLIAAAGVTPGELPWLADLALPGSDGERYPAGELLLPGSAFAGVIADDAPFGLADSDLLARWGPAVLAAAGVLDGFAVLREGDVPVDPDATDLDLDGAADWLADVLDALPPTGDAAPPVLAELVAVRDLELVRDDSWDRALALLPRDLLTEPAWVLLPDGRRVTVASYTRWWLARAPILGGRRPADLKMAGSDLAGLYDEAPPLADPELLLALGVRSGVESVLAQPGGPAELLDRLAMDRPIGRDTVRQLHARLALHPTDFSPPAKVRAVRDGEAIPVDPDQAVVVDAPDLLPLVAPLAVVPAPLGRAAEVADLLDVPLARELSSFAVISSGVPQVCRYGSYLLHDRLLAAAASGHTTPVPWRVVEDEIHIDAAGGPNALGRAFAWRDGEWAQRWLRAAVLRDPSSAAALAAEQDLD
ncbi:MAG: hypothetical protein ABJC62_07865 [Frankiaceae bacterium]